MRLAIPSDAVFMQGILERSDVRRQIQLGFPLERMPSATFLLDHCRLLVSDNGFIVFDQLADKVLQIHIIFVPDGNVFPKIREIREAVAWAFSSTPATEIVAKVYDGNPMVLEIGKRLGFRTMSQHRHMHYLRLGIEDWVFQDYDLRSGEGLREQLQLEEAEPVDRLLGFLQSSDKMGYGSKGMELVSRYFILLGMASLRVESWSPLTLSHQGVQVVVNPV
jgi:hypothetical protein